MKSNNVLYNGIVLPETWPPVYPKSVFIERQVLPVPYLENPPEVIPLGVGRELLVDDFLIDSHSCVRKFHYPEKYNGKISKNMGALLERPRRVP